MTLSTSDEEFSAFVRTSRAGLLRSACLLTAGDSHLAEDLVLTSLARLYVAWPKVRRTGTQLAYIWRILVNAHIDEVRRPRWRREQPVASPPDLPDPAIPSAFADGVDGTAIRAALAAAARHARRRCAAVLGGLQHRGNRFDPGLLRGHREEPVRQGDRAAA